MVGSMHPARSHGRPAGRHARRPLRLFGGSPPVDAAQDPRPGDNAAATPNERSWVIRSHGGYNADNAPFWRRSFWSTGHGRRCEPLVRFPDEPLVPDPACTSRPGG